MSIADKITQLTTIRDNIRNALLNKGVAASTHNYEDFASDIQSISTGSTPVLQTKTVSPATTKQTVSPDAGYDALSSVTVNAMPAGAQGTPAISKTVDAAAHTATLTASCTDTTGYITGSTKTSEQEVITASDLVDGAIDINVSGTYNVTNYRNAVVSVTPEAKVGSLVVVTCSSAIKSVTISVDSYNGSAHMENNTAYLVVPYENTGSAALKGYDENGDEIAEGRFTISSIGLYTYELTVESMVYKLGTWYGVPEHSVTVKTAGGTIPEYVYATDTASGIQLFNRLTSSSPQQQGIYLYLPSMSKRGFTRVRIKGSAAYATWPSNNITLIVNSDSYNYQDYETNINQNGAFTIEAPIHAKHNDKADNYLYMMFLFSVVWEQGTHYTGAFLTITEIEFY